MKPWINCKLCKSVNKNKSVMIYTRPGVSNWHFEGRMRPANMVCAARDEDQNEKI